MQAQNKSQMDPKKNRNSKTQQAAHVFLKDGKKLANAIYTDGLNKVGETENNLKEYSDELLRKVQQNPLASVLIAGGVGFLVSQLLKK